MGAASPRETPALLAARGVLSRAHRVPTVPQARAEMRRPAGGTRSPAGGRRRDSALRRAEPESSQRPFHPHRTNYMVRPCCRLPRGCDGRRLSRQGGGTVRAMRLLGQREDGAYGVVTRRPLDWSGRRDSDPRPSAWEADALPLSYARVTAEFRQNPRRQPRKSASSLQRPEAWEAGILPLNYGRPARSILLLERHGERLDDLVAPGLPVDPLADSVQIDLLVERHRGRLLDPELVDPVVLLEALLVVHDRLRLVHHPVELFVVPVHEDTGRLEQRHVEGLGVHRPRAPADQPDRPRLVDVDHVVQVGDEVVRAERGLDPGLGELAGHRLGHLDVTHIATARAV